MTSDVRPAALAPADEAILATIASRLARVDDELPRLTAWRPARAESGQLHVVRGRTRPLAAAGGQRHRPRRWTDAASLGAAAVIAVAVLTSFRLAALGPHDAGIHPLDHGAASASQPAPSADQASSGPSATAPAKPRPSLIRPGASLPTPIQGEVTPADPDITRAVLARLGARCGILIVVALPLLDSGVVRKLVATSSLQAYLPDGFGPGWIGSDPNAAARALKGRLLLAEAAGTLWVVRGGDGRLAVVQMRATPAGDGTTIWQTADYLWPVDCPAPGMDAKRLITGRAESEWPAGRVVDLRVIWPSTLGADRAAPQ